MIERAYIHVGGSPGCGKSTFVEALLGGTDEAILAARCVRDDALRRARETAPKAHPELRRYRQAGASDAALFAFPKSDIGSDAFFMTDLMSDYSEGGSSSRATTHSGSSISTCSSHRHRGPESIS